MCDHNQLGVMIQTSCAVRNSGILVAYASKPLAYNTLFSCGNVIVSCPPTSAGKTQMAAENTTDKFGNLCDDLHLSSIPQLQLRIQG